MAGTPSASDFKIRAGNLDVLPANVRAVAVWLKPSIAHGRWTQSFVFAINYPKTLSAGDTEQPPEPTFLDAIVDVYFILSKSGVSQAYDRLENCVNGILQLDAYELGYLPYPSVQVTKGKSGDKQIVKRAELACQNP